MIAFILSLIFQVISLGQIPTQEVAIIPAVNLASGEHTDAYLNGCDCHDCYWLECWEEGLSEFDRLFNATEVKWSKNGRLMVKGAESKTFKFIKKG